jgi:hypothetical protein
MGTFMGKQDTDFEPLSRFSVGWSWSESQWKFDGKYYFNDNMLRGLPGYQKDVEISPEALLSDLPQKLRWDLQSRKKVS